MKKFLTLLLILGMASMAHAAVQLSIDGDTEIDEWTLEPSQTVMIDIHADADYLGLGYIIIEEGSVGLGEWYDDDVTVSPYYAQDPGLNGYPKVLAAAGDTADTLRYEEVGWGGGYEWTIADSAGILPGGQVFEYLFHCTGEGDVIIALYDDAEGYDTPVDTITIHQVPEPLTLSLLGLGGLGILRRRR